MNWRVEIIGAAEREYLDLPDILRQRIRKKMLDLENTAFPAGAKKLRGTDTYRLRVGHYRIIYLVNGKIRLVKVLAIGHRRDVYRNIS